MAGVAAPCVGDQKMDSVDLPERLNALFASLSATSLRI